MPWWFIGVLAVGAVALAASYKSSPSGPPLAYTPAGAPLWDIGTGNAFLGGRILVDAQGNEWTQSLAGGPYFRL